MDLDTVRDTSVLPQDGVKNAALRSLLGGSVHSPVRGGYYDAVVLDADLKGARIEELERRLAEPEPADDPILMGHRAGWIMELGVLHHSLGELVRAEALYREAIALFEKLGRLEGVANAFGELGSLYATRGRLGRAEEHYRKALAIYEKLGRLEGVAAAYANLGGLCRVRGDRKSALEDWRVARDLYRQLGAPHMVEKVQGWIDAAEGRAGDGG